MSKAYITDGANKATTAKKRDPRKIIRDILLVAEGGTTWGPGLLLSAAESAIAIRYLLRKIERLEKKTEKQIGKQGVRHAY